MSIFKRGNVYWYHFYFNGEHIQASTKQGNPRTARQIEAARRTSLAKGEVGIKEKLPVPKLSAFATRFRESIATRSAAHPATVTFYNSKLDRLLEFQPLSSARLDRIDESLIDRYVEHRRQTVAPASVNRELATLRKALGLAYKWKLIDRIPTVTKLQGERIREFVLSHEQEEKYLAAAPEPLCDAATLLLDTGLRVGELCALEKTDVNLDPANGAKFGYLQVRSGKSKNAARTVSLTARASDMLRARMTSNDSVWVFPGKGDGPFLATSLNHQHTKVRTTLGLPDDFVIHSLRHTFLTRLGECHVDSFTLMRIAGHSSVTVSQRYVHPSDEAMERAFERLEMSQNRPVPATVSATVIEAASERVM